MAITKKKMNKKGAAPLVIIGIIIGIILLFAGTGVVKFLLTDKTPLILIGIFILLIMLRKKRGN